MKHSNKSYRPNVAAVIMSPSYPQICEFFIARRVDLKRVWQFPQGGIDEGESPQSALLRELKEEIGTDNVEVISECPKWMYYDFPKGISRKMYPFDGQKQKYFLVRLKSIDDINLSTLNPEFDRYKFISYEEIFRIIRHFKLRVYSKVLDHFKNEGFFIAI
ncbi:MAG: RNA pyrophosphohydrolase [Helicobacter sp.]|nr:RNA pyrophosphohydrolase [Helicobacter sp.]